MLCLLANANSIRLWPAISSSPECGSYPSMACMASRRIRMAVVKKGDKLYTYCVDLPFSANLVRLREEYPHKGLPCQSALPTVVCSV